MEVGMLDYKISELADILGITAKGIHYHEEKGLIAPQKKWTATIEKA